MMQHSEPALSVSRKGARRMADIPPAVRQALNQGQIATINLVEFLAVDLGQLLPAVAAQIGLDPQHPQLIATVDRLPALKPMQRHRVVAEGLWLAGSGAPDVAPRLAQHPSDLARQWAALQIALQPALGLNERLARARPFAADAHFGVREFAWMAVRDAVAAETGSALEQLQAWVHETDANLRRFASELTRPRGVWCVHLEPLKANPAPGLRLIEALRADPSRYVQNSVGNWLNDAAKSHPALIRQLCARWQAESDCPATRYLCRRGLRTLDKGTSENVTKPTKK